MTDDEVHSRRRAFKSGSWATLQQVVTLGSAAATSVIFARVLSVADFGSFSYVTTLAGIGTVVLTAGLSGLAIRVLVEEPERQRETMTALVVVREFFACVAYVMLLAVALTSGSSSTMLLSSLALTVFFARAFDASEIWFQSRAESQKTATVRICVAVAMLAVRISGALLGLSVFWLVAIYVAESVIVSSLLLIRYFRARESPGFGRPSLAMPRSLLKRSWLLALSSLANQVNTRGDIVVLAALLGSSSVGVYAAAARLSELFYFLPVVFMTATFPRLLQIRKRDGSGSPTYRKELQTSYDRAFWVGAVIMGVLIALGPPVIDLLYGNRYAEAGRVLQVHAIALPFVFMAAVFSKWIIAENLFVASLMRHALGAALNLGLNLILIPRFGLIAAAWSTVVSYFVASFLSCFATRSTRTAGMQMLLAIAAPGRLILSITKRG